MWCHHPDHTNTSGLFLSEALEAAEAELGVSYSGHSHPSYPRPAWCFPACPFGFVAQIPSSSLSSAKININSSVCLLVVSHLTLVAILDFSY